MPRQADELYTPENMADILGISVHTIYSKTSRRNRHHTNVELPPWIKIGRLIRFPVRDFESWLKRQERHGEKE